MTTILTLLNRFENAAGVYERSDDPAARDELHAARRAIVERDAGLVKALEGADHTLEAMSVRALVAGLEGTAEWDSIAGGPGLQSTRDAIRSALRTTS